MKNFKYTAILMILILSFDSLTNNSIHKLEEIKSIKKNACYRSLTSMLILLGLGAYNQKKIIFYFKNYPTFSILTSSLTLKLLLDISSQFQKINAELLLLELISKIYLQIESALLVEPNKEKCFELIHKHSGFSIEEIKEKTDEIINYKITCIDCDSISNINYQYITIDEISKDTINIEEIMLEWKNDPEIYHELLQVKKNKTADKEKFFEKIGKEIKKEMSLLNKEKI